jgi:hypothetical protein
LEDEEKNYEETMSELESNKDLISGFGNLDAAGDRIN